MDNQPETPDTGTPPLEPEQRNDTSSEQPAQWQYNSGKLTNEQEQPTSNVAEDAVLAQWTASEFIHHDKSPKWFLILVIGVVVISVLMFVITREVISVIVTVVLGVVFGMYAQAQQKTISYTLSPHGITADDKHYNFTDFKSYSVMQESAMPYIQLIPRQRFMVALSIHVEPDKINEIAEKLGEFVPYDQKEHDFVDKLTAKIRY